MGLSPRTHNTVSYFGAAVSYALWSPKQDLPMVCWLAHFGRRTIETLFVFDFSQADIPIIDSVQEFAYYWGFAAWVSNSVRGNESYSWVHLLGAILWLGCEYANYSCHVTLASLSHRKAKGIVHRVASGPFLFSEVTMPHYLFEVTSWVGFNILTDFTLAGIIFNLVGAFIMTCWAVQKHEKYNASGPALTYRQTPIFPFFDIRPPAAVVQALAK